MSFITYQHIETLNGASTGTSILGITLSSWLTTICTIALFYLAYRIENLRRRADNDKEDRKDEKEETAKQEELAILKRNILDWLRLIRQRLLVQSQSIERAVADYKAEKVKIDHEINLVPVERLLSFKDSDIRKIIVNPFYYTSIISNLTFAKEQQNHIMTLYMDLKAASLLRNESKEQENSKLYDVVNRLRTWEFKGFKHWSFHFLKEEGNQREKLIKAKRKTFFDNFLTPIKTELDKSFDENPQYDRKNPDRLEFLRLYEDYKIALDNYNSDIEIHLRNILGQRDQFNEMALTIRQFLQSLNEPLELEERSTAEVP